MDTRLANLTSAQRSWVEYFEAETGFAVSDDNLKYLAGGLMTWELFMEQEYSSLEDWYRQLIRNAHYRWIELEEEYEQ